MGPKAFERFKNFVHFEQLKKGPTYLVDKFDDMTPKGKKTVVSTLVSLVLAGAITLSVFGLRGCGNSEEVQKIYQTKFLKNSAIVKKSGNKHYIELYSGGKPYLIFWKTKKKLVGIMEEGFFVDNEGKTHRIENGKYLIDDE